MQETLTIYAAQERGVSHNGERVVALPEEPPDLLASLLQELGGVDEFGPVVEQEAVQEETLYSLISNSNCDQFLNMVTEGTDMTLPDHPVDQGFQPSSKASLSPVQFFETEFRSEGKLKSSAYDLPAQEIDTVGESPLSYQTPADFVKLKPAASAPKCQCSMHMLVGYPPSSVVPWKVALVHQTPIFASPAICLLFLRGYLKYLDALISCNVEVSTRALSLPICSLLCKGTSKLTHFLHRKRKLLSHSAIAALLGQTSKWKVT